MKYNVDIKSLIIGFLGAALLISSIGFKNNGDGKEGKFQAATGDKGVIILDTQTGSYIVAPFITDVGKVQWVKGDFYKTYESGKDNKKESNH
jgi:hypothetical protein